MAHPALFLCQGGGKNVVYCVKRAQTLMKAKDDRDAVDMLLSRPAAVPAVAPLVTSNAGGLGPPD